jgi:hypothetical protein
MVEMAITDITQKLSIPFSELPLPQKGTNFA